MGHMFPERNNTDPKPAANWTWDSCARDFCGCVVDRGARIRSIATQCIGLRESDFSYSAAKAAFRSPLQALAKPHCVATVNFPCPKRAFHIHPRNRWETRIHAPRRSIACSGAEMARVNVEDELRLDPRYRALVRKLGDEDKALGMCVRAWAIAQKYWGDDHQLIPKEVWNLEGLDPLVECFLAEARDGGVYCRGSSKHFDWYRQRIDAARVGGQNSVKARTEKYGSPLPANARNLPKQNRSGASEITEAPTEASSNRLPNPPAPAPAPALIKATPLSAKADPATIFHLWERDPSSLLPRVARFTDKRRRKAAARLAEEPDPSYWIAVITRLAASPFATGQVKSDKFPNGWRASFDWLVENDTNHVKVAEGRYDDSKPKPRKTKALTKDDI